MTKRSAARATTNRVPHAPAAQDFELVESTYAGLTFVDKAAKMLKSKRTLDGAIGIASRQLTESINALGKLAGSSAAPQPALRAGGEARRAKSRRLATKLSYQLELLALIQPARAKATASQPSPASLPP